MHARYRIENIIGQGGMGTIYRAYDRLADTWVALKQLTLELEDSPETPNPLLTDSVRLALAGEFRLLANLRHLHIVSVLDYGFVPFGAQAPQMAAFFTMEFLAHAQTLTEATVGQPLAVQLQLLAQLLQALEYIRRHQVVHRDLKPDNVLVQYGQVKVVDFGLAVLEGQHRTTMGSLLYMAPEVFDEQPLTHATDLFAVGVMAYEIFAGHYPFSASSLQELIHQIRTAEPDYAHLQGPAGLQAVVARLLAKDPAARFATAAETLAALAAASGEDLPLETHATRTSLIQAAQFVGREAELTQLTTALTQAKAGLGSAWLLGGESGVGKSRLLDELRIQALVQRAWVWHGQAVSEGGQPAQLWQQILRWLVLLVSPTDLESGVLKPFVPQLETLLERPVTEAPPLEAQAAQDRFCSVVLALLRRATIQQPVVLTLEDLQWAGPLSRALLAWVMRAVPTLHLLIVATYRNDEQPDLPQTLPPAAQLALTRLTDTQVAALTSAIFGLPAAQISTLVDFLYTQTEGNAFFVVEVLRSLAEEAGLLSQVQTMALPQHLLVGGIQQVVQRRLQRIAPADYPWLELAALAGRQLDLPLLQHLDPDFDWAAWLNRGAEAAVLEPQSTGWRFSHDQVRQSVLATLSVDRERRLHQTIAEGLEQAYAVDLTPHLGRLTHHYIHTNQVDKQRHYLTLAGQTAQAAHDYAEALGHYDRLAPLVTEAVAQLDLHLRRGVVLEVLGRWAEAEAAYQAALTLAQARQDTLACIHSQKALGKLARLRSDYPTALAWLTAAQQATSDALAPTVLAQIHTEMGIVYFFLGDYAQAQPQLENGLALAQAQNDANTAAFALGCLGNVARCRGDHAAAQTFLNESLALRQALGDKFGIAAALNDLGIVALRQEDYAAAQTHWATSLALRREIGDKNGIAQSLNNLGYLAGLQADYVAAQRFLTECLELRRTLGGKSGLAYALGNLGFVIYLQGKDYLAALHLFKDELALSQEIGEKLLIVDALLSLAAAYAALGHPRRAVQLGATAESLRQAIHLVLDEGQQQLCANIVAAGRAALPPGEFDAAWAAGSAMPLAAAIHSVLADPVAGPLHPVSL